MHAYGGPVILTMAAAVILILKYRRRATGQRSLLPVSGVPGRIAVAVAFVVGCGWAWSQGPSVVNAGVLGLSLAVLVGAAAEFLARRNTQHP
ncbi:hypothetical protein [Streptomyces acidiscabies]|uniref:hypothetical protein n=1 Tax=Streptomyces acidiscabies TaxID=42234 RepID=UPI00073EDE15|nr:hypothetical protein [Streptomyces acidiscabies]GAQ58064.1 hypothetical protein a10_07949 [Streptomyces acidiscabies]GAV44790.1 hypothetical protein Saa2_07769 [Streptomyces acidiscabies]